MFIGNKKRNGFLSAFCHSQGFIEAGRLAVFFWCMRKIGHCAEEARTHTLIDSFRLPSWYKQLAYESFLRKMHEPFCIRRAIT